MFDYDSIAGFATSIKAVAELAKLAADARDEAKIKEAIRELQSAIVDAQSKAIDAQSTMFQLQSENEKLKKLLANLESREEELDRYELHNFGDGTLAYRLKDEFREEAPEHFLCPGCYDKRIKSTLRFDFMTNRKQRKYTCTNCKTKYCLGTPTAQQRVVRRSEFLTR
ncbi:hypothetical protein HPQ64_10315 [Rhizobiales bacterium]|uniref:hypothetical protein n=1 Tax=Hongsoonwoonella zoysiae TaxID=2821844 RepID=UPI001560D623|nr:hypothetical protein [Hongsoonwoonella zoysiae]NRG18083.1 hypothetical protein [Hongsoonwoonella zoysiae]